MFAQGAEVKAHSPPCNYCIYPKNRRLEAQANINIHKKYIKEWFATPKI